MFNCGRALGPWGVVHPTVCFLLGTFFVTNLFLAMLVDSFLNAGVDAELDSKKFLRLYDDCILKAPDVLNMKSFIIQYIHCPSIEFYN